MPRLALQLGQFFAPADSGGWLMPEMLRQRREQMAEQQRTRSFEEALMLYVAGVIDADEMAALGV